MKFFSALLCGVLGAGILFAGGSSRALAGSRDEPTTCSAPTDVSPPVAAQPGTDAEAREYAQREAESPEVQDFTGGDVVIGVSVGLVVLVLLVILIIVVMGD